MNDHDIDPDIFARLVHDAERMRAEALRELLVALAAKVASLRVGIATCMRFAMHRIKWNLSVPRH